MRGQSIIGHGRVDFARGERIRRGLMATFAVVLFALGVLLLI